MMCSVGRFKVSHNNLIVRWNNKKLTYSSGEKVHPQYFENDISKRNYQRIKSSYIGHSEFNALLNHIEAAARIHLGKLRIT